MKWYDWVVFAASVSCLDAQTYCQIVKAAGGLDKPGWA